MDVYEKNGYDNRKHYLNCLAEDFGIEKSVVYEMASILGQNEDFDGLVTTVEDYADGYL
jgi:hypothetical protein